LANESKEYRSPPQVFRRLRTG